MPNRDKVDWEAACAMQDRDKMFLLYAVSEDLCQQVRDFSVHFDGAVEEEVQRLVGAGFLMESDGRLDVTEKRAVRTERPCWQHRGNHRQIRYHFTVGLRGIMVEKATGIDRFLADVRKFQGELAFHGQANGAWKLHSSATRRLIREYGCDVLEDDFWFSKRCTDYHSSELIQPARRNGHYLEDGNQISHLELLAKL